MGSGKKERSRHQTQWTAQFAVASELCKRGYEVSFTMGNRTPLADLMVVSPQQKKMFLIDVKGQYRPNPWIVKRKEVRADLYYVFAYVPDDGQNKYYVMTQAQTDKYIADELKRLNRPPDYPMTGIVRKQAEKHQGWDVLPK